MNPKSELILYQTEDNRTRIEVRLENETVWLTQAQLSDLFQRERSVITKHIRNIFEEGELVEEAVCANYAQTATDGKRRNWSLTSSTGNAAGWRTPKPTRSLPRKSKAWRRK
jgi:hypothetical protein